MRIRTARCDSRTQAPGLHSALLAAKAAGYELVMLDGILIYTDRVSEPGPTHWKGKDKNEFRIRRGDACGWAHSGRGYIATLRHSDSQPLEVASFVLGGFQSQSQTPQSCSMLKGSVAAQSGANLGRTL